MRTLERILIVDDNENNLYSLRELLRSEERIVDIAKSGEEGLKKTLSEEYSLILLDVQMPEMDGFECARLIKSRDKTKDLPIIFITAIYKDAVYMKKGFILGAVDYVTKPIDPEYLQNKVEIFLKLYRQNMELKQINREMEEVASIFGKKMLEQSKTISENVEIFNLVASSANDGFWNMELNSLDLYSKKNIIWFSPRFKELLGYEDNEFENNFENWTSLVHKEDFEEFMKNLRSHIHHRVPYNIEYRMFTKNKSYRWYSCRAQAMWKPDGTPVRIVGSIRDVTERKEAENSLKRAAAEWETTFNSISDLISIHDKEGYILRVNNAFLEYFHAHNDESFKGKKFNEVFTDAKISYSPDEFRHSSKARVFEYYDSFLKRHFEVTITPLYGNRNTNIGSVYVTKDISQRKKAEVAFQKYTEHIESDLFKKTKSIEKAQALQQNLNTVVLPNVSDINMLSFYMPSEELGGDFFDIRRVENKLIVIMADCMGHGIEASMDATLLRSVSDRHIASLIETDTDVFLHKVNVDIMRYSHEEYFPTMFVCVINTETKEITYSNANAELPYLVDTNDGALRILDKPQGFHLGFDTAINFEKKSVTLEEGQILLLYSDALVELKTGNRKLLNYAGAERFIRNLSGGLTYDLKYLIDELKYLSGGFPLEDDLTLLMFSHIKAYEKEFVIKGSSAEDFNAMHIEISEKLLFFNYSEYDTVCILTSLEEMYTNAAEHGNKNEKNKSVYINFKMDLDACEIKVRDEGEGFNPDAIADPTNIERLLVLLEKDEVAKYTHGRGIWMSRVYMDTLSYNSTGNEVYMKKNREPVKTIFQYEKSDIKESTEKKLVIGSVQVDESFQDVITRDVQRN